MLCKYIWALVYSIKELFSINHSNHNYILCQERVGRATLYLNSFVYIPLLCLQSIYEPTATVSKVIDFISMITLSALIKSHQSYFLFPSSGSLGTPSITVRSSFINKSCSAVTVECSVYNSQDLVLSWYRQEGRLTNVSSPDLSSNLYLTLEIESHDSSSYSCVAENPVEKKVTKLSGEDTAIKMGSGGKMVINHFHLY